MQVGAIQSSLGFTARNNRIKNNENRKNVDNNQPASSSRGMKNLAKGTIVGLMLLPMASPMMTSCIKGSIEDFEQFDCCGGNNNGSDHCHHDRDTITVRDTIVQIIENRDTIFIKDKFDSPVIDAVRDFFEANDIDLGDGRIPLRITYIDEQGVPAYNKQVFDGRSSSYNELSYDIDRTEWNDEAGSFVFGDGTKYENIRYSLTGDGKLLMMRYIPRKGVTKPKDRGDWAYSNSAVYDINKGGKVVTRNKRNDDGTSEYRGTFTPGYLPNSITVTNPYDTEWNYTNVKLLTGDAEDQ